ncbi:MAG: hypothetical protein ABSD20_07910, partial [Terriglobales bacterium]|jgi:hypothetical protein
MIFFLSLEYQFVTYIYVGYGSALGGLYAASLARDRAGKEETEGMADDEPAEADGAALLEETEDEHYRWESS